MQLKRPLDFEYVRFILRDTFHGPFVLEGAGVDHSGVLQLQRVRNWHNKPVVVAITYPRADGAFGTITPVPTRTMSSYEFMLSSTSCCTMCVLTMRCAIGSGLELHRR